MGHHIKNASFVEPEDVEDVLMGDLDERHTRIDEDGLIVDTSRTWREMRAAVGRGSKWEKQRRQQKQDWLFRAPREGRQ